MQTQLLHNEAFEVDMDGTDPLLELRTRTSASTTADDCLSQQKSKNGADHLSIEGYAQAVRNFANLSSGAGENHRKLAEILRPLYRRSLGPGTSYTPSDSQDRVLHLYRFRRRQPKQPFHLDARTDLPTCKALNDYQNPSRDESPGQLLFLRGHLSAEWLALLGSKHRIDPEFLSQTLDFRSANDRTNNFSSPVLPGIAWNIIKLPLMTIGSRDCMKKNVSRRELESIRSECAVGMQTYREEICRFQSRSNNPLPVGNTYVRNYHFLDETNFAFEHSIHVCLQPAEGPSGWTVLVWNDIGTCDVKDGYVDGPWAMVKQRLRSEHTLFFPVLCNKENTGLYSHKISPEKRSTHDLHIDYGRSMRQELMATDPLYALHEVFRHSICSERQFLNLLDVKLSKAIHEAQDLEVDNLPALNYLKEILYHHRKYNQQVSSVLKKLEATRWQQSAGASAPKYKRRHSEIMEHFQDLAEQAASLYCRCEGAITVLMNNISIAEARKSISQAERLGRLTFLAFIFVPLSFTTSVFGMNVREISQPGSLPSLKYWFALSIPVMSFALMLFYLPLEPAMRWFRDAKQRVANR